MTSRLAAEIKHLGVGLSWTLAASSAESDKGGAETWQGPGQVVSPPAPQLLLPLRAPHAGTEEAEFTRAGERRALPRSASQLGKPGWASTHPHGRALWAAASPPLCTGGGPCGARLWRWDCACLLQPPGGPAARALRPEFPPKCFVTAQFVLVWTYCLSSESAFARCFLLIFLCILPFE